MRAQLSELWKLHTSEPEPAIDHEDLRFSPEATLIERNGRQALLLKRGSGDDAVCIVQDPDGRREQITAKQARYSLHNRTEQREIRVFLSSTFQDMQAERSYLVKVVFPRLKRFAQSQGVVLNEIDLRWGVSLEEAERGETVAICLDEIDRCRACPPFFIGLLAERYGWIPEARARDALDSVMANRPGGASSQWIRDKARDESLSVTEMEIRYGVLDTPEMQGHAFFYTRSPALSAMLAEADTTAAQAHRGDPRGAYYDDAHAPRQDALKQALRERGLVRVDGYRSVEEMGDDVERAIMAAITRVAGQFQRVVQFQGLVPVGLDVNETLSQVMQSQTIVLPRHPALHTATDRWLDREHRGTIRVLITGPAGSGKATEAISCARSAKARWLGASQVTLHCRTGVALSADDAFDYLRTTMTALGLLPRANGVARAGFGIALAQLTEPVIVLVTDVDLLSNSRDMTDFLWANENANLAVILTATNPQVAAQAPMYLQIPLDELTLDERRDFVRHYLARFRKSLDAAMLERVVGMPLAGSPYFLQLLLDELRRGAVFETLGEAVDAYSGLQSLDAAFQLALAGWMRDTASDDATATRWRIVLETLAIARSGVPNDFFVSERGAGISPLQWATWQGRAETALLQVQGAWRLRDRTLLESVSTYCFGGSDASAESAQVSARRRYTAYLGAEHGVGDIVGLLERMDQLIWLTTHDSHPDDLAALHETLAIPENVTTLIAVGSARMITGWSQLLANGYSIDRLIDAATATADLYCLDQICRILIELGRPSDSEVLARRVLAQTTLLDLDVFQFHLCNSLFLQDRNDEALAFLEPILRNWQSAPGKAPPRVLGVLLGMIVDGHMQADPWWSIIENALVALLQMDPTDHPDVQLMLLVGALPLIGNQGDAQLTFATASRAISVSYNMPNPGGPRMRLLVGFQAIDSLRMLGHAEEAVRIGKDLIELDVGDLAVLNRTRALCMRGIGHSLVDLGRWAEAVPYLEHALVHEPLDGNDFIPLIVSVALLAICKWHLGQIDEAERYTQSFVGYFPRVPQVGVAVKGMLKAHFELLKRTDDLRRLDEACPG